MELIEAKEILIINVEQAGKKMPAETLTAVIIGISAITRIATMRSFNMGQAILPLKGETSHLGIPISKDLLKRLRESPLGSDPTLPQPKNYEAP